MKNLNASVANIKKEDMFMKYTKENIVDGINAKLDEMYGGNPTTAPLAIMFKTILPNYPKEIEQNVLEWVNDQPFSLIDCHGASIKEIVDGMYLSQYKILILIKNFIDFEQNGFNGNAVCYRNLQ